jgi:NAD(P)-dependent dehydrogenase (short-subunit alcohol dehydrogenase family)
MTGYELAGKVAFVAGGTRGIGFAVSRLFARSGATVVCCGSTAASVAACNEAAAREELAIEPVELDVQQAEVARSIIDSAAARHGRLDILVSCAGRAFRGSALDTTAEDWDRCLAINLRAPFLLAQAALPHVSRQQGSIVFISSIWAVTATANRVAYIVAKSALTSLARALAVDVARSRVRVNAVAPGYVDTAFLRASLSAANPDCDLEDILEDAAASHPLGRIAHPDDIAEAVLYLASDRARLVTGQTLIVDAGLTTQIALSDFAVYSRPAKSE